MDFFPAHIAAVIREIAAQENMEVKELPERHGVAFLFLKDMRGNFQWDVDFLYYPSSSEIEVFIFIARALSDSKIEASFKSRLQLHPNRFSGFETLERMFLEEYSENISPETFREKALEYIASVKRCSEHPAPYYRRVSYPGHISFLRRVQKVHPWPHNPDAIHLPDGPVEFPPMLAAVIRETAENRNLEMTTFPERWGVCEIELMGKTNHVTWDVAFMYSPRLKEVGISLFAFGWQAEEPSKRSFLSRMFRRAMGVQETVKSRYERLEHIDLPPLPENIPPEAFKEEILAAIGRIEGFSMRCEAAPLPVGAS